MQAAEVDRSGDLSSSLLRDRRELVARCRARLTEVVEAVAARYRHEMAPFMDSSRQVDVAGLQRLARLHIEMLLTAVEEGSSLHDDIVDESAVEPLLVSEFPPVALMSAREAATGAVWRLVSDEIARGGIDPDASAQILAGVGATLLEVSARRSGELRRRLGETSGNGHRGIDELRCEVVNALLVSPHLGESALRRAAERVGYHLSDAHAVALLSWNCSLTARSPLVGEAIDLFAGVRLGTLDPIVQSRATEVVAIYPFRNDRARNKLVDRLGTTLKERASSARVDAVVTFGGIERGTDGIAASYEQARRTLDAARATETSERAVAYAEMLPVLLLLDSPRLAADLRHATIEPLIAHDAEQRDELVVTLRALLDDRGNASAAAKRLHVHRHTLASRQERIERLTGLKLRDSRHLLMLELGLKTLDLRHIEPHATARNGNGPQIVHLRSLDPV